MENKHGKISTTVLIGVAVLLLIFGIVADFIGYNKFTETITAYYKDSTRSIAQEATTMFGTGDIDGYLFSGGTTPEFIEIHDNLEVLCNKMDAEFIFIVQVAEDYSDITFVMEVVNEKSKFDEFPVGYVMDITQGEYKQYQTIFTDMIENDRDESFVVQNSGEIETGYHMTAVVAIRDGEGKIRALLNVQKQMEYLNSSRNEYVRSIVIASLILIVAAGTSWYVFMRRRLIIPISEISSEVIRFSEENIPPQKTLKERIKYKDELGTLAETIDYMEQRTLDYYDELSRISAEKQRVDTELGLAADIQANILPRNFPAFPQYDQFDIYAIMDPAKEVGGDFYDLFMVDERHAAIVVADVSGKGVPAALFMMIAKTLIKIYTQMHFEPSEVFKKVNNMLCENNERGIFVTAWMGVIDIETGVMRCTNAGHNPPLVRHGNSKWDFLRFKPCLVLAAIEEIEYTQEEVKLEKGDRILLYTDGITEATNSNLELYGEDRLNSYLNNYGDENITDVLTGLRKDIDQFAGEAEQFDDITMLILDYKGKTGENG